MSKKSYKQHCGLARALDIVGERWTLLLIRELLLGPRKYSQLLGSLQGLTTNLLAKRLETLQRDGLVSKSPVGYSLTVRGKELEPALLALGAWGQTLLAERQSDHRLNPGWALVSLKRRYRGSLNTVVELRVGTRCFELTCGPNSLEVAERAASRPALLLSMSEPEFFRYFMARLPVEGLVVAGEEQLWEQFRQAFELPGQ